jgi:hypothetical protein
VEVIFEKYVTLEGVEMMQDSLEAWTAEGSPMKEVFEP